MEKGIILEIVLKQIRSLVDTLPQDEKFEVQEHTGLFGKNASIDSLSLVSVIVDLEAYFADEYNLSISLTDDRAMTREVSPFNTVSSLADYLHEIINEK
jgi:acyl carrier protein